MCILAGANAFHFFFLLFSAVLCSFRATLIRFSRFQCFSSLKNLHVTQINSFVCQSSESLPPPLPGAPHAPTGRPPPSPRGPAGLLRQSAGAGTQGVAGGPRHFDSKYLRWWVGSQSRVRPNGLHPVPASLSPDLKGLTHFAVLRWAPAGDQLDSSRPADHCTMFSPCQEVVLPQKTEVLDRVLAICLEAFLGGFFFLVP